MVRSERRAGGEGGAAEARLEAMVRGAPMVLAWVDVDGVVTRVEGGPATAPWARVGARARDHAATCGAWVEAVEAALRGGDVGARCAERGDEAWVLRVSPVRGAEGALAGAVSVCLDVSAWRAADRARERAQVEARLGVLAGGVAHAFNNLLTAMMGNAAVAMMDLDERAPARAAVADIAVAAQRAAELTRLMLASVGKGRVEARRVDLSALVRAQREALREAVPRQVRLRFTLGADLPAVSADAAQVRDVVECLVRNGAESHGDGAGVVTVRTGALDLSRERAAALSTEPRLAAGRYVFVAVRDTGSGVDAALRERIFEPFFSTKFAGRGLGLSAVRGIVRGHGGAVTVDSARGRGSTFTALFPALG